MATAQVCRRCPDYKAGIGFCERHKKQTGQWNDWCKERAEDWKAWRMAQTKGT